MVKDFGPPTVAEDISYYVVALGSMYAGEHLSVKVSAHSGVLAGIFTYLQKPGNYKDIGINDTLIPDTFTYGDPFTLSRYGTETEFETEVSKYATGGNPWVIVIAVRLSEHTSPTDITVSANISQIGG